MKWFDRSPMVLLSVSLLTLVLLIAQPISTAYADSLREVAERVARQNDAKLVSAREVTDRDGRRIYVIRILTRDGVVRTIRVPARDRQAQHAVAIGNWQFELDTSVTTNVIWETHKSEVLRMAYPSHGVWA